MEKNKIRLFAIYFLLKLARKFIKNKNKHDLWNYVDELFYGRGYTEYFENLKENENPTKFLDTPNAIRHHSIAIRKQLIGK